ncbi:4-galactosyl-N-acetylglucosaminide 3-alpha-L-fucosyltransferase FUT6-like [Cylas formicarius]|uniref:4-galactosyl-N-acetylglucosaminide 3-alpha-L-fucosyltransferase FUT6-like n=1 Tax=Cylas formicarius TaxID=197179 RepID=UPI0029584858|nr:4-galactosyl-N-acetylglucosaminide 3-alpha-L-fucosyltransferase FUT6-like [Cylas formicarius]XP_060521800.1 4-galactosyl-N-acetylglucosaminide 3-alpha-L-fucosyltransferase FUT6-like [Cylas formicarius]
MGITIWLKQKKLIALSILLMTLFIFLITEPRTWEVRIDRRSFLLNGFDSQTVEEWRALRNNLKSLSKLGEVLFQNAPEPKIIDSTFQILVWKYGPTIENRHLKHFSDQRIDPFEGCPVRNCNITYDDEAITTADIVIMHLHRFNGKQDLPTRTRLDQIWAFLTDESPLHTFLNGNVKLDDFDGLFNWSMTYRMDSDIPVPYGRTALKEPFDSQVEVRLDKRRDVLVAILGSNCQGTNHRWKYVAELQKHIQVDVYGGCGRKKECPGHFQSDCQAIDDYLFYLSFENSNCDEYITEKLWWNAFHKNSIPIVMGSDKKNYRKILPPQSYINVDDFASPSALAQNLLRLNKTGDFKSFYRWKANFQVLNEHGYFKSKSYHYCRICQALNYNNKTTKVYDHLTDFWSIQENCHPAWDTWTD